MLERKTRSTNCKMRWRHVKFKEDAGTRGVDLMKISNFHTSPSLLYSTVKPSDATFSHFYLWAIEGLWKCLRQKLPFHAFIQILVETLNQQSQAPETFYEKVLELGSTPNQTAINGHSLLHSLSTCTHTRMHAEPEGQQHSWVNTPGHRLAEASWVQTQFVTERLKRSNPKTLMLQQQPELRNFFFFVKCSSNSTTLISSTLNIKKQKQTSTFT